jgi:hypothetical protein
MKTFKFSGFHIEPIYRDLIMVVCAGVLIAMALISVAFMIFH